MAESDVVLIESRRVPYFRMLAMALLLFAAGSFIVLTPLPSAHGSSAIGAAVFFVGAAAEALVWAWLVVRTRRHKWAVRIGPDGVTWSDGPVHVAWSDVAELRVARHRRWMPWSLDLPGVRLVDRAEADFAIRASSRPSGYAIDTRQLQATPESVLAAISRFAQIPVVQE